MAFLNGQRELPQMPSWDRFWRHKWHYWKWSVHVDFKSSIFTRSSFFFFRLTLVNGGGTNGPQYRTSFLPAVSWDRTVRKVAHSSCVTRSWTANIHVRPESWVRFCVEGISHPPTSFLFYLPLDLPLENIVEACAKDKEVLDSWSGCIGARMIEGSVKGIGGRERDAGLRWVRKLSKDRKHIPMHFKVFLLSVELGVHPHSQPYLNSNNLWRCLFKALALAD